MSNLEKKISLPSEAIKIYKMIDENSKISIKELEKQTKLDRGKLEHFLGLLVSNELISRLDIVSHQVFLTNNGKEAAEKQLVERRIAKILKEKESVSFDDLSKALKTDNRELNAGIGLLKKQGLIEINKGQISLLDKKKEVNKELQLILEKLLSGEIVDTSEFNELLFQRNLASLEEVKEIRLEVLIPYKEISTLIQKVSDVSRLTPEMIRDGSWRNTTLRSYNLKASPPSFYAGRKQPYAAFLDNVKQKLCALGFKEMRGPAVELEFWNFDALFQAQNHSAREWSDVYSVSEPKHGKLPKADYVDNVKKAHEDGFNTGSKGWRYKWNPMKSARLVLRAHGTSVSARTLVDLEVPSKYFSISRCYRPDTVDATHLSEFTQVEGIVVDPSITFRDLLGILKAFAVDIAQNENFKFKPDYYPFTEPSVELDVLDPNLGWIEFGGAGIFRPEVTKPFGIEEPVIAWGLGIERLFMVKHGIADIRELFNHKFSWLRSADMSRG